MVPIFQNLNIQQPKLGNGQTGISDNDVQRIASAMWDLLLADIGTIVDKRISPFMNRVETLEAENTEVRRKFD